MAIERANQFKMMLSDEELRTLRDLAEADGVTASDYLRLIIRQHGEKLAQSQTLAGRLQAKAQRFQRLGATEAAAHFRDVARELKRLKPPSLAEVARREFADASVSKKGKSR